MSRLQVTSEIYTETDFKCSDLSDTKSISTFTFFYPTDSMTNNFNANVDKDGDLVLVRRKKGEIKIAHHKSTDLTLVGLQVWRGALLLADYIFHNRRQFKDKHVLELGSGVGLTGIAAAIYSKNVVCTDIDLGEILSFITENVKRNATLIQNNVQVLELNFKIENFSDALQSIIANTEIVIAADGNNEAIEVVVIRDSRIFGLFLVIYDDELTEAFVATLVKLLESNNNKVIYIALEKRYVFTVADLESLAPCYEHFLTCIDKVRWSKNWKFESIPIDFPQYFEYERVKELVLLKLSV